MKLEFVHATAQDADAIFALSKALIDAYEDTTAIDYEKVLAWVHRKIHTNIGDYICVRCCGEKAAYYRVCTNADQTELDDLYVLPAFRGRGIGTQIVKKCISESSLPLMLYVFTANTGAIRLYERLGFQKGCDVGATRQIMVREAI